MLLQHCRVQLLSPSTYIRVGRSIGVLRRLIPLWLHHGQPDEFVFFLFFFLSFYRNRAAEKSFSPDFEKKKLRARRDSYFVYVRPIIGKPKTLRVGRRGGPIRLFAAGFSILY